MESILIITIVSYYILFPLVTTILVWNSLRETKYLDYVSDVTWTKDENRLKKIDSVLDKIKQYEVIFIVVMLLILPFWSYSASVSIDNSMHTEWKDVPGPGGGIPFVKDPIVNSVGPTYDTDSVLKEMDNNPNAWLPDEVDKYVDMDELTNVPGRLALYRLYQGRYIITYTYLTPYPIIKTYGFLIYETNSGDSELLLLSEKTFIYPSMPSTATDLLNN